MKKAWIIAVLAAMLLCACSKTQEEAGHPVDGQQAGELAAAQVGMTLEEVSELQIHVGEYQEKECFSVQFTVGADRYEFVIEKATGKILYPEG